MKKTVALLLILVLTLSTLCACKKQAAEDGTPQETSGAAEETTAFDITTTGNYYQDLSEPEFTEGVLTYKLYQAWWEEDALMMQVYFINGHDAPVTDLFIENFYVYNSSSTEDGEDYEGGLIASAQIGPLEENPIPIEANSYRLITICLSGNSLEYPNADLSTMSIDFTPDYSW